ncbi:unnamed protein product [Oppiella nova]|uniref:Uncharacterized protein n=1 Tax=Oppiella nova TaxID=334625 RepID=A0A7R9M8F3_9ACAR|nr:unnamed protein product [Oppiella nova]CAG2171400.1 unnamed protein product [Oppiella nova]
MAEKASKKYRPEVDGEDEDDVTNLSDIVGPWGQWQRNIFIYFFIGAMCSCWHSLGLSFYAPNVSYWCAKPHTYQNMSDSEWIERTVGTKNPNYQCQRYDNPDQPCDSWQYDQSFWRSSIISEQVLATLVTVEVVPKKESTY